MKKFLLIFGLLFLMNVHLFAQVPSNLTNLADSIAYFKTTAKPITAINTDKIENAPTISANGNTMIFVSNRDGVYKLYESHKKKNKWSAPKSINEINVVLADGDYVSGPSLSFDGNKLYFFAKLSKFTTNDDIYVSERGVKGWQTPKPLAKIINSDQSEGYPSISPDGNSLYFVRTKMEELEEKELRKLWEGKRCFKIMVSKRDVASGEWKKPESLPFPLNKDCETAPRIMPDGKTLIFSSNRLGGLGNYDLYQTQLDEFGDWKFPFALGYVNSDQSDQFSAVSAAGDILYYSVDGNEIYEVQVPEQMQQHKSIVVEGKITDGKEKKPIKSDIIITDAYTSKLINRINSNESDGAYTMILPTGKKYNVEFTKSNYSSTVIDFDLTNQKEYEVRKQNIKIYPEAELKLQIADGDLFEAIEANVKVKEVGVSKLIDEVESNRKGIAKVKLPFGRKYEVIVDKTNFSSEIFTFDLSEFAIYTNFLKNIELQPKKRKIKLNISDLFTNGKVKSKIRIRNKSRNEVIEVDGNESVSLRVGDRYEIEATSNQGYAFKTTTIDVTEEGTTLSDSEKNETGVQASSEGINLKLQPLKTGTNLSLRDILFESNSIELDEISFKELDRVVKLLKQNPLLKIEIAAHTDNVGNDLFNLALSRKRAESVSKYLTEKNINSIRFVAKGFGEKFPVVPNDTEENKARNRRVVLKILEN